MERTWNIGMWHNYTHTYTLLSDTLLIHFIPQVTLFSLGFAVRSTLKHERIHYSTTAACCSTIYWRRCLLCEAWQLYQPVSRAMPHTGALRPEHVSILQSNTTFHFLSGHHILSQTVKVECIKNLTLTGNETFVPPAGPLQSDLLHWLCWVLFCCYAYTFHWQPPFSGCGALMVNIQSNQLLSTLGSSGSWGFGK